MTDILIQSHKYNLWLQRLRENGNTVHGVTSHFIRQNHAGDILFALLMLDATTPEGNKMLPICFLKGEVVSVLICLIDEATHDEYLLLVRQRRICDGGLIYEHVAGMVDGNDQPLAVAVREASEEAGIMLAPSQLIALNDKPLYPSTGTSDEALYFYYTEIRLPLADIRALDSQQLGVADEHEHITTHIVPRAEAPSLMTNTNALLNYYLYMEKRARR